jgi:hypothetical protein
VSRSGHTRTISPRRLRAGSTRNRTFRDGRVAIIPDSALAVQHGLLLVHIGSEEAIARSGRSPIGTHPTWRLTQEGEVTLPARLHHGSAARAAPPTDACRRGAPAVVNLFRRLTSLWAGVNASRRRSCCSSRRR